MSWISFRGESTEGMAGVYVSKMPNHRKASKRMTEYYVKGRDGALHVDEGYDNFDFSVLLVLVNANVNLRQIINAWADGTGKLVTSDDPSKAYIATVKDEIEWTRTKANDGFYDTARIVFNCQPYMIETDESDIVLTASGTVMNPGTLEAFPILKVEGSGSVTFVVNGYPIEMLNVASGVPVYIDCENGYVHTEANSAYMRGEIPKLSKGGNTITFGNNLTKLTITPHWRWL